MNRINPRLLGILVIAVGVCAALPFKRLTTHRTTAPPPNSETIEWRSNDFTLEVTAQDESLGATPYDDNRPESPAFGDPAGTVKTLASLDTVTQPPALAGAYEPAVSPELPATGSAVDGGGQSATTPKTASEATPTTSPVAITHEIVPGDTLEDLAERHLGSRLRWTEIYNANPEILSDPEVMPVGVTIVILPRIQPPATSPTETDSLVPVSSSDLLKFRQVDQ